MAGHRAHAADEAVGRGVGDEVVDRPAAALGGDDHRAVLHEAAGIEEVVDVLPGGAVPGLAPPGDRVGPGVVEADGVAARGPRPGRPAPRAVAATAAVGSAASVAAAGVEHRQDVARLHLVAHRDGDRCHDRRVRRPSTTCSIFMDSSTTTSPPGATASPTAATRTTVPCSGERISIMEAGSSPRTAGNRVLETCEATR